MKRLIYLDFAASTPCAPSVVDAMLPFFCDRFGNASSLAHSLGAEASDAVDRARAQAAALVGSSPHEIVWTSCATEANNLALQGVARAHARTSRNKGHLITAMHEHKSVLATCRALSQDGFEVTFLPPDASGGVTVEMVEEALREETILVSIMAANNELGTVNDFRGIGSLCRRRGIAFHCDGTQWVGKMPLDLTSDPIDLLTWSGHKIYGPKGVGALFLRSGPPPIRLEPLLRGGGHERGLRSGSLNVPGIIGFGEACRICREEMAEEAPRLARLRDRLEDMLVSAIPGAVVHGQVSQRLPHISSVTFPIDPGRNLVQELTRIACSSGSACDSNDLSPSHVLRSIGLSPGAARNTLRLSLGRPTTEEEIDLAAEHLIEVVRGARSS